MDIKILVATHKAYQMPKDDIYLPIHVGKEGKTLDLGYIGDNTGENISYKNANYSELTALYWAWKNLKADYIGLAHYRRHFCTARKGNKWASVLTTAEAKQLCNQYDVIVPNKRRYYIETSYSQYAHHHKNNSLDITIDIIKNENPEYRIACDTVLNRTWAHMFNMFIMRKEVLDAYCTWLFDILFKLEKRLDDEGSTIERARLFGYPSERMLDMWLEKNSMRYGECRVTYMEKQNWVIKGGKFMLRKLC